MYKRHFFFSFLLLCSIVIQNKAQEWIYPNNKLVQTIYYQGMNSSQTQAAKYTGNHGFISPTTLERVTCSKSIDIVKNLWVNPEIDEVAPGRLNRNWGKILFSPRTLFPQLWSFTQEFIFRLANRMNGIQITRFEASNRLQTLATHSLRVSKINIAQEGDLANHQERMDSFYKECPDADSIMMGVSRGAATTFQAAARYNKEAQDKLKAVKLIHLEGCFDTVEHTMKMRHPWLLKSDFCLNNLAKFASHFIAFKKDGTAPIKMVADFPKQIPVAFISSKKDREVPAKCTKTLINALLKEGHRQIYYLELDNSGHTGYMCHPTDKITYQNFMHALFKECNLPYIPDFAQAGKHLVEQAKVTQELVL